MSLEASGLTPAEIDFGREVGHAVYCEGVEIGSRRTGFVVDGRVVVKLKASTDLDDVHLVQAKNHMVAYGFEVGLPINFGGKSLEIQTDFHGSTPSTPSLMPTAN